jgi:riboflavin synthase
MFTGLIEALGRIQAVDHGPGAVRLRIGTGLAPEMRLGDSLAVNGVCLTVAGVGDDHVVADVGPETLRVTTLGSLDVGRDVNLERPMRADARFGGHFVQGHVDTTGCVTAVRAEGDAHWLSIGFDPLLASYFIPKGSVAVDGISLTVAALRGDAFDVMLIPHTWRQTNVHALREGDRVNLECDMIGKYVARATQIALGAS